MAAVAPPADQAADLLKNLAIDSQTKALEIPEPTKKASVDSGNNQVVQPNNKSTTPDFMDPTTLAFYPNAYASAYYYSGYDGTTNDWDEYARYMNSEGMDLSQGVYGYGYAPYGYQYPYFQPMTPTTPYTPTAATPKGGEVTADKSVDTTKGVSAAGAKGNVGSAPLKPTSFANSGYNANGANGYSPFPWLDGSLYSDPQIRNNGNNNQVASKNQNGRPYTNYMGQRPISGGMNATNGYTNRMYPQTKLYGNAYQTNYGYGYNMQNGRGWLAADNKYNKRGNGFYGYNNENGDGLNELNRGPRAKITKNQKTFTPITVASAVKGQSLPLTDVIEKETKPVFGLVTPDREQYNKVDFPETYADAKFFIIKSYSEDDVHKSIKYNVWASTQNGNKKLDAAYNEAQQKAEVCPVFLFFSVNTSGQFVGVAEMVGPVDFNKSLEFWQQDKWIGCFPVKWHIVKDLPNSLLKHIILENNENKPVTNSRDTQEVKLDQGLEMVKIFKEHCSKQCILDDFEFYEDRQKRIQEKKAKQQQYQKQAWGGKPIVDDDKTKEGVKVDDVVNVVKVAEVSVEKAVGDLAKPEEKKVVANGC